ncbi:unnamed protein product [Paramecium primaurelia]|uniref:Uncharacterized protein n=1 Tax=Paramecium primaurelia TaxID=5886 RepID=A0A8S1QL70_PARPR|nr:unnamed protein product [Paramecium primaurelia]
MERIVPQNYSSSTYNRAIYIVVLNIFCQDINNLHQFSLLVSFFNLFAFAHYYSQMNLGLFFVQLNEKFEHNSSFY